MDEIQSTKSMSWRASWLEKNASFQKVEVNQSADPQLVLLRGACLAATARWAKEMIKDDRRLDEHVVKQLVATANQHRAALGLEERPSIFGPKIRQMQAAAKLTRDRAEVFRRAGITVDHKKRPPSIRRAVIQFARTMLEEGRALFFLSFKTETSRHVIGLHGNRKDLQFGFFDANIGIYRYGNLTAFANALEDLLLDYYKTVSGEVVLLKIRS